jgi:hypothetical protein
MCFAARGTLRRGFLVSAAAIAVVSSPAKENAALMKTE